MEAESICDRISVSHAARRMRFSLTLAGLIAVGMSAVAFAKADEVDSSCPRYVAGSEGLPTRGEWRTHPALADVNGDGHLDIAGNPRKGRGPQLRLVPNSILPPGCITSDARPVAVGDFSLPNRSGPHGGRFRRAWLRPRGMGAETLGEGGAANRGRSGEGR